MILQLLIDSNVTDRQTDRLMNGGNHSVTDRLTNVRWKEWLLVDTIMLQTDRLTNGGNNNVTDGQTD